MRRAIKQAKSASDITTELRRAKMLYMQEQALMRVITGTTSINEMIRVLSKAKEQKQTTEQ
jgi:type II secretory ATPase GspE/PulE/Tfp pilus assembly ATPase PilB-like protein